MQQIKISAWGNSLGFRIPRGFADNYNLQAGDILDSFASSEAAPPVDFGEPKGEEIW